MSLKLSKSKPAVEVKTFGPGTTLKMSRTVDLGDYEIPMDDFCEMVWYVLTNTSFTEGDPRELLVTEIKKLQLSDTDLVGRKIYKL